MRRDATSFQVGPSGIRRDGSGIVIDFDEISVPRPPAQLLPRRIKGTIRFSPDAVTPAGFRYRSGRPSPLVAGLAHRADQA
jgi:carotenoid 1,2-hydratase